MLIGYGRVSTRDQNPQLQEDALLAAGCEKLFIDRASGARRDRPELAKALEYAREGDTIVVWKVDRLARSLHHLIEMALMLDGRGLHLKIITMDIDTRTPAGKALYQMAGVFAEFEREIIRERTRAGLDAAKGRGVKLGRPPKMTSEKVAVARELLAGDRSVAEIARMLGVSRAVLYDALAKAGTPLA